MIFWTSNKSSILMIKYIEILEPEWLKKSVINMLHNYISGESESVPVLECKA